MPFSSGPVFTGDAQHLIVELLAEEERRFEQLVEFGTNSSNVAGPLGFSRRPRVPITLRPAASANRLAGRSSMRIALAPSSTARAMASHSPSPSRPRDVRTDAEFVGARTSNQCGRTGIEGAISRATASGISADLRMAGTRSRRWIRARAMSGLEFETTDTQSFLMASSSWCSSSPSSWK